MHDFLSSGTVSMLTRCWEDYAVSSIWEGSPEDFIRQAYLTRREAAVPEKLLSAADGDSAIIRWVYEPLFALIAGLVNLLVGCDLTYVVETAWHEACQFLLLDLGPIDPSDGMTRRPTHLVAFHLSCDPRDLTFAHERELTAFIENSVKMTVSTLTHPQRAS